MRSKKPFVDRLASIYGCYIPPPYPNGWVSGSPFEYFTKARASEAVRLAARALGACKAKTR